MANTKRNTSRRSSKYEAPKPRRITKQEQAKVARLIKVARELALLPYVTTSSYKQSYNRR
jgi:ribosomal protein S18